MAQRFTTKAKGWQSSLSQILDIPGTSWKARAAASTSKNCMHKGNSCCSVLYLGTQITSSPGCLLNLCECLCVCVVGWYVHTLSARFIYLPYRLTMAKLFSCLGGEPVDCTTVWAFLAASIGRKQWGRNGAAVTVPNCNWGSLHTPPCSDTDFLGKSFHPVFLSCIFRKWSYTYALSHPFVPYWFQPWPRHTCIFILVWIWA